jgi:hypothetical protein
LECRVLEYKMVAGGMRKQKKSDQTEKTSGEPGGRAMDEP